VQAAAETPGTSLSLIWSSQQARPREQAGGRRQAKGALSTEDSGEAHTLMAADRSTVAAEFQGIRFHLEWSRRTYSRGG